MDLDVGGYANDAIWGSPPAVIWDQAIQTILNRHTFNSNSPHAFHVWVTSRDTETNPTLVRNWRWRSRLHFPDAKRRGRWPWPNIGESRRRSIQIGDWGCIGLVDRKSLDPYPKTDSQSDADSIG